MAEGTAAQLEPVAESAERRRTILVVDDDESQVLALEHRLRNQGYRVLTAYDAQRGRNLALEERPDLVLLDVRLPDQDGLELCSQLADHPQTCGVPIIILSALEGPNIVRQARAVGGSYYVRKPYDPNVLLTLIEASLEATSEFDW